MIGREREREREREKCHAPHSRMTTAHKIHYGAYWDVGMRGREVRGVCWTGRKRCAACFLGLLANSSFFVALMFSLRFPKFAPYEHDFFALVPQSLYAIKYRKRIDGGDNAMDLSFSCCVMKKNAGRPRSIKTSFNGFKAGKKSKSDWPRHR